MSKKLVFSNKARNTLANGVDKLASAVTATLGPAGRNVIIEQQQGNPVSTKDGVTVAKSIELKNKVEIYGLNYKDNRNDAKEWLKTKGNPYKKIIFDYDGSIAIDFGVYGAAETFIVDKLGYIIHKHVGPIDQNYYNNVVIPLIEK